MDAEKYLSQITKIDAMIENKAKDYRQWMMMAESMSCRSASADKVHAQRDLQQMQKAIGRYVDIEREITVLRQKRETIIQTIEQLPPTEYDVVFKIYAQGQSLKEVAYEYGKSYRWARRKKQTSLYLIQRILDERDD